MAVVDASCNRTAINVCQVLPLLVVNTTISNLLPSNCFLFSLLTAFWRKPNSPKPNWNPLTQDEKEIVSALGQLAAQLSAGVASGSVEGGIQGAVAGKNAVENNFLNQGRPQKYADRYIACSGDTSCEQNARKDMAKESAENIQKLKSCWDAGDTACVADSRSKMELDEKAYTELRQQDNIAGRAYEDSANWYADISDQCAGKCGWLEAALLKTGAEGLSNLVYGALGAGSVVKSGQSVKPEKPVNVIKNQEYIEEPPFNPLGTGGAAQPWSTKGRIKYVELPTKGKIRFVPDSNYSPSNPQPRGPNDGYVDKFGNEWFKGPSRTAGQAFEWDVQLSSKGKAQLGWATRDGSHLNISLDGKIRHK